MELRHLNGMEVEACIRCGAVLLDRADLEELTAGAVLNAPTARGTDPGPTRLPPKRRRTGPWDITPHPAPPRVPDALARAAADIDDTAEDGPIVTGSHIHDSEPPVQRRMLPPSAPPPIDMNKLRSRHLTDAQTFDLEPEPLSSPKPLAPPPPAPPLGLTLSPPTAAPPPTPLGLTLTPPTAAPLPLGDAITPPKPAPPPPSLGRTITPADGREPTVSHLADVTIDDEPLIGGLPDLPEVSAEPHLDLGYADLDSTEEVPLEPTEVDGARWSEGDDDILEEWQARQRRKRVFAAVILGGMTLMTLFAIVAVLVWSWVSPRVGDVGADQPSLSLIEPGEPSGKIVAEKPVEKKPVEDTEPAADAETPGGEPTGEADAAGEGDAAAPPVYPEPEATPPTPKAVAAPEPISAPEPVAAPEPTPTPKPVVRARPSRATLIAQGWAAVEQDQERATQSFGQVLASNPEDYEANYGYGYALLEKGLPQEAQPYLCRALPSADVTIKREVSSLLSRNGLSCD